MGHPSRQRNETTAKDDGEQAKVSPQVRRDDLVHESTDDVLMGIHEDLSTTGRGKKGE